jgi:hypothetical protein
MGMSPQMRTGIQTGHQWLVHYKQRHRVRTLQCTGTGIRMLLIAPTSVVGAETSMLLFLEAQRVMAASMPSTAESWKYLQNFWQSLPPRRYRLRRYPWWKPAGSTFRYGGAVQIPPASRDLGTLKEIVLISWHHITRLMPGSSCETTQWHRTVNLRQR